MQQLLAYTACFILITLLGACKRDPYFYQGQPAYKDEVFTGYFKRSSGWIAGDGAGSVPLSNGQSLWTFGDSYINSYDQATQTVPCLFQARNAGLLMGIQHPETQTTLPGSNNTPNYFTQGNAAGYWIWPGSGYQFGDTLYHFATKFWNNNTDTTFLYHLTVPGLQIAGYQAMPYRAGIDFGSSIIKQSDYYYIYGTRNNSFGNDLFVARFPAGDINAPWQYFSNIGWTTDLNAITRIWDEFTASFAVCQVKNKYVLVTTEFSVGCDQGKNIYVATADNPFGPFGQQHSVWQVDDTLEGHYPFFYLANPHTEYNNGRDELLITYCINGYEGCTNTCFNGRMSPDVYRPRAIRVPYKAIHPTL